jgi:hypothetical protein
MESEEILLALGTLVCGARGFICRGSTTAGYRRRLPHLHPDGNFLFLTWRLWGSLPVKRDSLDYPTPGYAFAAFDRILDRQTTGPLWRENASIAELVPKRNFEWGEREALLSALWPGLSCRNMLIC